MEKIIWAPSFSVGVATLDRQHKHMIEMINSLIRNPEAEVDSEMLSAMLGKVLNYGRMHFKTEERILEEYGYPELAAQRWEHRAFRKRAATFCVDTMNRSTFLPTEVLEFLKAWWTEHILGSDMKYRTFLNQCGVR